MLLMRMVRWSFQMFCDKLVYFIIFRWLRQSCHRMTSQGSLHYSHRWRLVFGKHNKTNSKNLYLLWSSGFNVGCSSTTQATAFWRNQCCYVLLYCSTHCLQSNFVHLNMWQVEDGPVRQKEPEVFRYCTIVPVITVSAKVWWMDFQNMTLLHSCSSLCTVKNSN